MRNLALFPKRGSAVLGVMVAASLLVGCGGDHKDPFVEGCSAAGGKILEDSESQSVVTVNPGNGGVGVGSSTVTVRLCIVDGDIVDMEVK